MHDSYKVIVIAYLTAVALANCGSKNIRLKQLRKTEKMTKDDTCRPSVLRESSEEFRGSSGTYENSLIRQNARVRASLSQTQIIRPIRLLELLREVSINTHEVFINVAHMRNRRKDSGNVKCICVTLPH